VSGASRAAVHRNDPFHPLAQDASFAEDPPKARRRGRYENAARKSRPQRNGRGSDFCWRDSRPSQGEENLNSNTARIPPSKYMKTNGRNSPNPGNIQKTHRKGGTFSGGSAAATSVGRNGNSIWLSDTPKHPRGRRSKCQQPGCPRRST